MGGQVLGGGVIVLVAVLLWLVYLLPTWQSRRQYDAAERNAVRLNQALRVLAETSETPAEVHLELTARTALAQQKLARRALAEREQAALEDARVELERARDARAAAKYSPEARMVRARRRLRLVATSLVVLGLGGVGWGAWELVSSGTPLLIATGVVVAATGAVVLRRMARVGARQAARVTDAETSVAAELQDVALGADERAWAPRDLPRPLTASAGSRAAATLDAEAAREALRQAALEEAARERAEAQRPPSIETARRPEAPATPARNAGDAEIEAHVRELLARRAAGQ